MSFEENASTASFDSQIEHLDVAYAIAASPAFSRDGICFVGRPSGLYRSEDGGDTWSPAYDSLNLTAPLATSAVAVSPAFESDHTVFAGVNGGVLYSLDAGLTWQAVLLPSPPPLVSGLAVSPNYAEDGAVFASTVQDGVFHSADRGNRWVAWNFGLLDFNAFCLALSPGFATDDTVVVGTESGIFRSTNGGRAWREVPFPSDWAPVLSLALSPGYARDGILFAGTEASGLFRSDDKGVTWSILGEDVMLDSVNALVVGPQFPAVPDVLALLGQGVLLSRDGGQNWTDITAGLDLEEGLACVAVPHGLATGAPALAGLGDGRVLRLCLP